MQMQKKGIFNGQRDLCGTLSSASKLNQLNYFTQCSICSLLSLFPEKQILPSSELSFVDINSAIGLNWRVRGKDELELSRAGGCCQQKEKSSSGGMCQLS